MSDISLYRVTLVKNKQASKQKLLRIIENYLARHKNNAMLNNAFLKIKFKACRSLLSPICFHHEY